MTKIKKNIKGITLIALVVTIVVLLILSSISIATLYGENGIITNATWAAFSTEMTGLDERLTIKEIQNSKEFLANEDIPIFTEPV